MPRIAHLRRVQPGRGTARSIQANDVIAAGGRQQHKTIAADPGHLRFAQAQQNRARDGRIHGIAARFQDLHRNLGRQRMRCGAHAIAGQHGRSARSLKIAHLSAPQFPRQTRQ